MIELALWFQVLVWLIVLGVFLVSGQASIFHPLGIYLGFHLLVFVIRPMLVYFFGFNAIWNYMVFEPDSNNFILTLAVASVGLVVFATMSLMVGRANARFVQNLPPSLSPTQSRALVIMTVALAPLIAYSIYKGAGDTGGERTANGVFILTKTTGYITDAQFMIAPLLCLWLLKTRFHWLSLIPVLLYVAYRSWCGWARWTIILFLLTVVLQYCWYRRLRWLPAWTLAVAVPALILFNVLGRNRDLLKNYLSEHNVDQEEISAPGISAAEQRMEKLDTQDFANFDYLAAVVSIVPKRTQTYTYGAQYLQLFTEPIPRILWPGKPAGAPVQTFDINQYANFTGLTFSLVGDGWCSGGWIGVVITLGLAGTLVGFAHRLFWSESKSPISAVFYLSFLGISANWYRDGGISVFKFLLWTWLPLLMLPVVTWFMTQRRVPGWSVIIHRNEHLRIT
jgi:hypothetical protein